MTTARRAGQAGLQGWRAKVADGIAPRVADRAGLDEDGVRAVVGAALFVLAALYVGKAVRTLVRDAA